MNLVFATNNPYKLAEIKQIITNEIQILSLNDINCHDEVPETKDTLEGNALDKARFIYKKYNINCFADDTGLEIDALNGKPGVFSARYAGPNKSFADNMNKVLLEMDKITNRKACFRTVIALIINGNEHLFEGEICGSLLNKPRGKGGFGYDPIFLPENSTKSFAELTAEEKNNISHRKLAIDKLIAFFNNL